MFEFEIFATAYIINYFPLLLQIFQISLLS